MPASPSPTFSWPSPPISCVTSHLPSLIRTLAFGFRANPTQGWSHLESCAFFTPARTSRPTRVTFWGSGWTYLWRPLFNPLPERCHFLSEANNKVLWNRCQDNRKVHREKTGHRAFGCHHREDRGQKEGHMKGMSRWLQANSHKQLRTQSSGQLYSSYRQNEPVSPQCETEAGTKRCMCVASIKGTTEFEKPSSEVICSSMLEKRPLLIIFNNTITFFILLSRKQTLIPNGFPWILLSTARRKREDNAIKCHCNHNFYANLCHCRLSKLCLKSLPFRGFSPPPGLEPSQFTLFSVNMEDCNCVCFYL